MWRQLRVFLERDLDRCHTIYYDCSLFCNTCSIVHGQVFWNVFVHQLYFEISMIITQNLPLLPYEFLSKGGQYQPPPPLTSVGISLLCMPTNSCSHTIHTCMYCIPCIVGHNYFEGINMFREPRFQCFW